eukprot:CAMPEP_0172661504 /NCGR_PEP_ID=MMETSP1074-20121228/4741_1 /TAXON_ID=2916 /ORGANISM="Ceratium fusus, Strain PA161109" /LENGTH=33 /DNA_ID= /DNA_START= /DNA_END= /DNA_ORIENTATION=
MGHVWLPWQCIAILVIKALIRPQPAEEADASLA